MPGSLSKLVNQTGASTDTPRPPKRKAHGLQYEQLSDASPTSPPKEEQKRIRKAVCIDGRLVYLGRGIDSEEEYGGDPSPDPVNEDEEKEVQVLAQIDWLWLAHIASKVKPRC